MGFKETSIGPGPAEFPQTVWTSLQGCFGPPSPDRDAALNRFASLYWKPVYAFIRRAASPHEAKDLTQAFFCYLLEGDVLSRYRTDRGRLRNFLKGVLRNFLSGERREHDAQKRGGGKALIDLGTLEDWAPATAGDSLTPEETFDRQWAAEVLALSLADLRQSLSKEGKDVTYRVFEAYELPSAEAGEPTYADIGRRFGLTEHQVKNNLDYAREQLESIVRRRLSEGVSTPEELLEEMGELFSS